jgi:KamA family protein
MNMAFDHRGRLWVSTSQAYPHVYPGSEPRDRLVILEDTDGDGKADTSKVFAADLHLPLSFEFGAGGVYVSEQPHLTFLADTDGDDRADVHEVILSGGDPLLLDDVRLGRLVDDLASLPHVRRLRIHSRLPIVLPARITAELVAVLSSTRLACVVVVHANHPAELDGAVADGVAALAEARPLLLNQSVLLAGVNDSVDVLRALSERLIEIGVVPYYLHLLDRVRGTAAFAVDDSRALAIHGRLREVLPGYAVPRLAREVPGEPAKVWLG